MNIKGKFPKYKVWSRAQADIDRITEKIAQAAGYELRVGGLDVRKAGFGAFEHGRS